MFKVNKCLLASAIAAAVALPTVASAQQVANGPDNLVWTSNTQITFARELIVNDGISLVTPHGLLLQALSHDSKQIATVKTGHVVRFKVTLEGDVVFNENASLPLKDLIGSYVLGEEFGGDGVTPLSAGTNGELITYFYTTGGTELVFDVKVPGDGKDVQGGWAISINGLHIKNLVNSIGKDAPGLGGVTAEITAQSWDGSGGRQILAGRQVIAKSKWGVTYSSLASNNANARIDVVGANSFLCCGQTGSAIEDFNGRARFSPSGVVGGASASGLTAEQIRRWSPGGVRIDIAKSPTENGTASTYVLNFSGDGLSGVREAWWNVQTRSVFDIKVVGTNLAAFDGTGGEMFLSRSAACTDNDRFPTGGNPSIVRSLSPDKSTMEFKLPASVISDLTGTQVTSNPPGPTDVYFCMVSDDKDNVMVVNPKLTGDIGLDYRLPTQRLTPPRGQFELSPLLENGVSLVFQNVNPGKNATAQSFLRLTNNNAFACPVTIDAKDDAGKHSGEFRYTLEPHASEQFNIDVLETGVDNRGRAVEGALDPNDRGTGKWYVRVTAGCGNFKGSALNRNATNGTVTNLTPEKTIGNQWLTPSEKL